MRIGIRVICAIGLAAMAGVQASYAQGAAPEPRVRVGVNVGLQPTFTTFNVATLQPIYVENATVDTSYKVRHGWLVDGAATFRVRGGFGIGAAVTGFEDSSGAQVTGAVPHPFFFNTPRTIDGTATGVRRQDIAVHMLASYTVPATDRVDVTVSGGPSIFRSGQDFVTRVSFTDAYPFDSPAFSGASLQHVTGHAGGYNAGVDLGIRVSQRAGIGGLVRFSRATLDLTLPDGTAVSSHAGGLQASGGVRLYF